MADLLWTKYGVRRVSFIWFRRLQQDQVFENSKLLPKLGFALLYHVFQQLKQVSRASKEEDTSVEDGNFPVTDGTHDVVVTSEAQGKASPSHSTAPVCPKTGSLGPVKADLGALMEKVEESVDEEETTEEVVADADDSGNGFSKFPSVLNSVEDLKAVGDLGNTLLFSGMGVDSPKVVCSEGCSGAHEVLDVLSKRDFHVISHCKVSAIGQEGQTKFPGNKNDPV
ncbi:hypothetical protein U1Q18_014488 [Sarracenia purpurea var. burkii]